jgi:hypothetical protein
MLIENSSPIAALLEVDQTRSVKTSSLRELHIQPKEKLEFWNALTRVHDSPLRFGKEVISRAA